MPIERGRAGRAVAATLLSVALALLATAPAASAKTRSHPRHGVRVQQHRCAAGRRDDPRGGAPAPPSDHQARRHLRPRGPRPREGHAVHHRRRPPHDLPPDVPDRRRGPRPRELPDADGGHLSRAGGAARRPARSRRRAARMRDRVDLQHAQRPRPELRGLHRLRGARRGRSDRVRDARAAGADLLQRGRDPRPGAAALLDRRRRHLDPRADRASTGSGRGIPPHASRASSPPARPAAW